VRLEAQLQRAGILMLALSPGERTQKPLSILCLGAHSDDIEIGCGATILYLAGRTPKPRFHWVVFTAAGQRAEEAARAADLFAGECHKEVVLKDFRDGFLPYDGGRVKDCFEEMKARVQPDIVFTHWQGDAHQDHRLLCELTWNTYRDHFILEYEIPKYDGDVGRPNVFVTAEEDVARRKADRLVEAFASQRAKHWFDRDLFLAQMRIRGMEAHAASGYAEAFHCRKIILR
jgi:LmbE family N-acetylglucosaminyl deacetylase